MPLGRYDEGQDEEEPKNYESRIVGINDCPADGSEVNDRNEWWNGVILLV
jgi:hypothetical protein